ncbi:MAG: histidinol dehydrogenase, partial [Planctomycetota bacterium]
METSQGKGVSLGHEFDQILISHKQADFDNRLRKLRFAIVHATRFKLYSKNHQALQRIMQDVFERGDEAVAEYTLEFDGVKLSPEQFRVCEKDLKESHDEVDSKLLQSIRQAIANVRKYQEKIFVGKSIPGKVKYTPIERVGICVPGASAPLPSTVIMTAVPAQVARVKEIVMVSPPRYKGTIHPVILAVCHELGIEEVYRIGGAQAVAALAQGTGTRGKPEKTIRKVYKIVGPGNQWVSMAKREVLGLVDIDSVAGPSEVLIIANDSANPAWIAADMLSQAEHDPGSSILFTDSENLAGKVRDELEKQVAKLDRAEG